ETGRTANGICSSEKALETFFEDQSGCDAAHYHRHDTTGDSGNRAATALCVLCASSAGGGTGEKSGPAALVRAGLAIVAHHDHRLGLAVYYSHHRQFVAGPD